MTARERFESYVYYEPNTGCWLWGGCDHGRGYGRFYFDGVNHKAHRAAYLLLVGPVPQGRHVLHTCDVKSCVNPQHLYVGTHQDNMRDAVVRGRIARDERAARTKLAPADVRAIRADTRTCRLIAADYGVRENTVSRIRAGTRRAHVQ